ncbi:neurogenic locus Notch protein, partial [Trichonephila inaurata madagascariensis]
CKCTGGSCVMKDGKQVCQCPPEFGNYSPTLCKACECGKGANCTYEQSGWFSAKKTCICPNGYLANGEKCIAVSTSTSLRTSTLPSSTTTHFKDMSTPSMNSDSTIRTTKTFPPSTRDCDCGKYARDCTLSYWGKVCDCMTGYTPIGGICE